jgi:ribosomal-protein-alanine N-acetyltransferase
VDSEGTSEKIRYKKKEKIKGTHIQLHHTVFEHADKLFQLIQNQEILKNLTIQIQNMEDYVEYLRFMNNQWRLNQDFTYTVLTKEEEIVGQVSLYNTSFSHQRAEMGVWIGHPFHHQGYGTKALVLILEYAFETLHFNRIQAHIFTKNRNSQQLFEKVGFQQEGLHRQYVKKENQFLDVYEYALLKSDWQKNQFQNSPR